MRGHLLVAFVVKRKLMLFLYAIQDLLDILFYAVDDTLIFVYSSVLGCRIESVQDFFIKLDIKPLMHLLKISTFSLNNVIVRLAKIMNTADKN